MSYQYKAGIGDVGSYQVAGQPYVTGSTAIAPGAEDRIVFPRVAKAVTIINTDTSMVSDELRIHYNSESSPGNVISGLHFVSLTDARDSFTFTLKCKEIYISAPATNAGPGAYQLIAELTCIDDNQMPILTGSGLTD
tara:strand:+ start:258 stop:668 length:411 start_codon:yes stop_codon:yes gene_type:complete